MRAIFLMVCLLASPAAAEVDEGAAFAATVEARALAADLLREAIAKVEADGPWGLPPESIRSMVPLAAYTRREAAAAVVRAAREVDADLAGELARRAAAQPAPPADEARRPFWVRRGQAAYFFAELAKAAAAEPALRDDLLRRAADAAADDLADADLWRPRPVAEDEFPYQPPAEQAAEERRLLTLRRDLWRAVADGDAAAAVRVVGSADGVHGSCEPTEDWRALLDRDLAELDVGIWRAAAAAKVDPAEVRRMAHWSARRHLTDPSGVLYRGLVAAADDGSADADVLRLLAHADPHAAFDRAAGLPEVRRHAVAVLSTRDLNAARELLARMTDDRARDLAAFHLGARVEDWHGLVARDPTQEPTTTAADEAARRGEFAKAALLAAWRGPLPQFREHLAAAERAGVADAAVLTGAATYLAQRVDAPAR